MDLELNQKTCRLLSKAAEYEGADSIDYEIAGKKVTVIDLGVEAEIENSTATELGILAAEASTGTLGKVRIEKDMLSIEIPELPAVATLSCQLAGWAIGIEGNKKLGSGPARILARKPEKIIDEVGYAESSRVSALMIETDTLPGKETCEKILVETGAKHLYIAAFRGDTQVGLINVLARIVEVGIFRLHNIGYDVKKIASASGSVPLIRLGKDSMYEANDAIIYHGKVSLETRAWDLQFTEKAISRSSPSYGKSFKDIYREAGCDFYKIDGRIFAPAALEITDLVDGRRYAAGRIK